MGYGSSVYKSAGDRLAEKLLRLVCQTRISPNEVIMSPALLKR